MTNDKLREVAERATRTIFVYLQHYITTKPSMCDGVKRIILAELTPLFPAPEPVDDKALAEAIARLDAGDTSCLLTDSVEVLAALRAAQQEVATLKKERDSWRDKHWCAHHHSQEFFKDLLFAQQEVAELREWKRQQLEVESSWDTQAVGKLLGVPFGKQIRPAIAPGIKALQAEVARLRKENTELLQSENRFVAFARYYLDSESTTWDCDRTAKAALSAAVQHSAAGEGEGAT